MNDDTPARPSRRAFMTNSIAVAAGVGAGVALVKAAPARAERGARFVCDSGVFPECPVAVEVALPTAREGVRGRAWLHIRTPSEHLVEELGEVVFHRGEARIDTRLVYPYETRVAGSYSYHVEVACGAERVVTAAPVTYSMRQFYWFC